MIIVSRAKKNWYSFLMYVNDVCLTHMASRTLKSECPGWSTNDKIEQSLRKNTNSLRKWDLGAYQLSMIEHCKKFKNEWERTGCKLDECTFSRTDSLTVFEFQSERTLEQLLGTLFEKSSDQPKDFNENEP